MDFAIKYKLGDPEFGCFYMAQYDAYSDVLAAQLSDQNLVARKIFVSIIFGMNEKLMFTQVCTRRAS